MFFNQYLKINALRRGSFNAVGFVLLSFTLTFAATAQSGGDENYIDPTRPTVSESATTPKPGVLQLEYGFTSYFGENSDGERVSPFGIRFAPNRRIRLDFDLDVFTSQCQTGEPRMTGIGDSDLGIKYIFRTEPKKRIAYAINYLIKLPSASVDKGLGNGRVDHTLRFIVERTIEKNDFTFNAAYLNVGNEDSSRRYSGAQVVLSYGRELPKNFSVDNEIYAQNVKDTNNERGIYEQSVLNYKINKRLHLDTGVRFGFGSDAARFGIVGGLVVGVGSLYGSGR